MFLQETTPDTSAYMIAGYAIFFILIIIYLASLFIRSRNLNEDLTVLESMKDDGRVEAGRAQTVEPNPVVSANKKSPPAVRKKTKAETSRSNKIRKKVARKK